MPGALTEVRRIQLLLLTDKNLISLSYSIAQFLQNITVFSPDFPQRVSIETLCNIVPNHRDIIYVTCLLNSNSCPGPGESHQNFFNNIHSYLVNRKNRMVPQNLKISEILPKHKNNGRSGIVVFLIVLCR